MIGDSYGAGLQPATLCTNDSQGGALGWYGAAPSARRSQSGILYFNNQQSTIGNRQSAIGNRTRNSLFDVAFASPSDVSGPGGSLFAPLNLTLHLHLNPCGALRSQIKIKIKNKLLDAVALFQPSSRPPPESRCGNFPGLRFLRSRRVEIRLLFLREAVCLNLSEPIMSEPDPTESKRPSGTGKPFQRRVRYSGKNPRHYSQKYKELDPQRDPETIAQGP